MTVALETEAPAAPRPYWGKVAEDVWQNLPGLLLANLIFLVWCGPVWVLRLLGLDVAAMLLAPVTVGPGLAGLAAYAGRLARGEPAGWWRDSLRGCVAGFGAGIAIATVILVAVSLPVLALRTAADRDPTVGLLALLAAQGATALIALTTAVHVLGLVGLYRQRARTALRNALLLALRSPGSTAGLVGVAGLALHLAAGLGWAPLVILPAALVVCVTNHTLRLVRAQPAE